MLKQGYYCLKGNEKIWMNAKWYSCCYGVKVVTVLIMATMIADNKVTISRITDISDIN